MGQWALTFDVTFQYPVGPVCNWPNIIDCTLTCSEDDECQENSDCSLCSGGYCNMDCGCTYPTPCQCSSDQDCDQFDGICDVPHLTTLNTVPTVTTQDCVKEVTLPLSLLSLTWPPRLY